jgi:hypothetical protein
MYLSHHFVNVINILSNPDGMSFISEQRQTRCPFRIQLGCVSTPFSATENCFAHYAELSSLNSRLFASLNQQI